MARIAIRDFELARPIYIGATVTVYEADENGEATSTKATLYEAPTGTGTLSNPQTLDSEGKFEQPVYVDGPVVCSVSGLHVGDHDTAAIFPPGTWRGDWATDTVYYPGDMVRDGANGGNTRDLYVVVGYHTSDVWATDSADSTKLALALDVSAIAALFNLPDPGTLDALDMLRVNAGQDGYEGRSASEVLSDIGALGATGDQSITSTDAGAAEGPGLELYRNSASPADNDVIGALKWAAQDNGGNKEAVLKLVGKLLDVANGSEDAELEFHTIVAGALAARMVLGQGLRIGSATGGDPGAGKINAQGYQHDGKAVTAAEYALTDAATIAWDMSNGPAARVTLGGNRTLGLPTNAIAGQTYVLRVIQDGTGGRTLAYNAAFKWPGGAAPTVASGANDVSLLTFYYTGTEFLGTGALDFS